MDRNTRIGFALIFLLLIGWSFWMSRQPSPTPEPTVNPDSLVQDPVSRPEPDEFTPSQVETPKPAGFPEEFGDADRRQILVETDLARYLFDTQGATIRRLELKAFEGVESEFVDLIGLAGADSAAVLGVGIDLPAGLFNSETSNFTLEGSPSTGSIRVSGEEERTLIFRLAGPGGAELVKRFTFRGDSYDIGLGVEADFAGRFAGARSINLDWSDGILSTEKNRKDDVRSFNNYYQVGDEQQKKSLRNFKGGQRLTSRGEVSEEGTLQWLATKNKYFLAALIPDELQSGQAFLVGDNADEVLGWQASYPLRGGRDRFDANFTVYAGPIVYDELKAHGRGLEHLVDMGKLIRPISLAIKWLMDWLSRFIPNYGVIIILMSIFTKALFYRLSHKSLKSMKQMQNIQPELKALQEKHKDNKERLNKEMMALYKEHGVNPLGGCLPLLLQMPVFFALYRVLRAAVELRGAGFMLWIDDLSNMDVIYELPFAIPLVGGFIDNSISVLPILMGLSMWVQQKLGGSGMGMGAESAQAGQMAAMNKIMPFFMTFIFYRMPSGLVLYWLVNNILQAAQQWYIHKGLEVPKVVTADSQGDAS